MKRFVLVIALTGLMSVTALAGEIPTNGAAATPTPTPQTSTATTTSSTASTSSILLVTVILTVLGLR
ncbi:MAG TPA: hypothetical protein VN643_15515 [Pyrinomonadaceae bacterium]|jgi:hypothetical protein|nr:hypothetical protein [Pyrinomonadaceae bacterium]HXI74124.1 hypothetical protein [Pyrinomonadaceae bacterium]